MEPIFSVLEQRGILVCGGGGGGEVAISAPIWSDSRRSGQMNIASFSRFGISGFESWPSQTEDFKIDTCHFLAGRSVVLG